MDLRTLTALCVSGAAGVLARYAVDGLISARTGSAFPWGTFVINVSGAFLLGLLASLMTERYGVPPWLRLAATFGFLGAYTTFSTLSLETLRLIEVREYVQAGLNSLGSLGAGLIATYLGLALGRAL